MRFRPYRILLLLLPLLILSGPRSLAQGLTSDSPAPEGENGPGKGSASGSGVASSTGSATSEKAPPSGGVSSLPSSVPGETPPTGAPPSVETTPPAPPISSSNPAIIEPPSNGITTPSENVVTGRPAPSSGLPTGAGVGEAIIDDDYPRLRPEEYTLAGGPRHTLSGKLPYRETHLKTGTAIVFGGALLGLAGSITWYQQAWYPDSTKAPFHLQTDWGYSKQFDKAGHMFGGWMSAYCSYESFVACGLSIDDAALWGSIGGLFFQTFMEVQDGFFSYGFDPTDELSNIIGAAYFYAQQKVPFLQNFDPKWSVGPNPRDSAREASQIRSRIIVDDYDRQDVWLSARVHNLLPESLRPYWPKWLQLAIGAGARDVELTGYSPHRVLHLSLDYNLVELLPDLGPFGNWLVQGLNHFHLPAPALRLWPTVGFELLYPFRL